MNELLTPVTIGTLDLPNRLIMAPMTRNRARGGQVTAWRRVTDAVHRRGGRIAVQIMHAGRIGHPCLYPGGELPLAPSAIRSGERLYTPDGLLEHPTPREMTLADIDRAIEDFVAAARLAMEAGFDAVELRAGHRPRQRVGIRGRADVPVPAGGDPPDRGQRRASSTRRAQQTAAGRSFPSRAGGHSFQPNPIRKGTP